METKPHLDTEVQEGRQYWCLSGPLFKRNKLPTEKLDRLLRGIASSISSTFGQHDHLDLTPPQLSAFYRAVGGNYDPLFRATPPQSIAFIYRSLGCLHSLQPSPGEDGYSTPSIPALKPKGFVTWQTIQVLLGPEEHVPFLQRALQDFNVLDPDDGTPFPKYLPTEAFPTHPDDHMVAWHKGVSERLRLEAQADIRSESSRRSSREASPASHTDEREDAAQYFSNPFFRNRDGRPAIVDQIIKAPGQLLRGGQMVVHTMRNIADPHLWSGRRRSWTDKDDDADESDKATPTDRPHHRRDHENHHHRSPRRSPRPTHRRERSPSYSSASDEHNRARPVLRRHRSHEPPPSPRTYFDKTRGDKEDGQHPPQRQDQQGQQPQRQLRPQQHHQHSQSADEYLNQEFRPSDSPPFAAKVANLSQPPGYFDLRGRPPSAARPKQDYFAANPSFRPMHVPTPQASRNLSPAMGPPRARTSPVMGSRPMASQPYGPVKGVDGRRYPAEVPWR